MKNDLDMIVWELPKIHDMTIIPVSFKPFVVVSSVPWLQYGDYALQKMLLPAQAGDPQKIKLAGNKKKITLCW